VCEWCAFDGCALRMIPESQSRRCRDPAIVSESESESESDTESESESARCRDPAILSEAKNDVK
jgi:hypothetical protein